MSALYIVVTPYIYNCEKHKYVEWWNQMTLYQIIVLVLVC